MNTIKRGTTYDYLVVVDFEATCDEGENPVVTRANQEIIEFPWVVVDCTNGKVVDSQHLYVKPEWTKTLTPFCIQLTGITDAMVNSGVSLREAISQFDTYAHKHFTAANKTFCFLSDGAWDLKYMLKSEAKAKGIPLAAHYATFFDVRIAFAQLYRGAGAKHLTAMLKYLDIAMDGRHHSGISDSLNISKIVARLLTDGYRFETPETIPEDFVPEENYKDFCNPSTSSLQAQSDKCAHEKYVRLRGLPWTATYNDIHTFMAPLQPVSVHLPRNSEGRLTGEGFCEFTNETDANAALAFNKKLIGTRYVEVFKCSKDDVEQATKPPKPSETLKMRGLPYHATTNDILVFFDGFNIVKPNGIVIAQNKDGRPAGEAFVKFSTVAEAEAALAAKNRQYIANRYIELVYFSTAAS